MGREKGGRRRLEPAAYVYHGKCGVVYLVKEEGRVEREEEEGREGGEGGSLLFGVSNEGS